MRQQTRNWMLWYAIALHVAWGVLLLLDERTSWVTAIAFTQKFVGSATAEGILYLVVAALAAISIWRSRRMADSFVIDIMLCTPQQIVLVVSAASAVVAIFTSSFADGVVRPRAFIAADQLPSILAAILHTCALWDLLFGKAHETQVLRGIRGK